MGRRQFSLDGCESRNLIFDSRAPLFGQSIQMKRKLSHFSR
jgi:hypothetical protein